MTAPRPAPASLAITFLQYRDLAAACRFYEEVLGLERVIDQGWSKIYRLAHGAHLGLVDEARGSHRAAATKPVQICLRVPDVAAWHLYAGGRGLAALSPLAENRALGIRAFTFEDPEGYQIEIQSPTRPRA